MRLILKSQVRYDDKGMQALLFTAEGDMRQALNNLQCTVNGYEFVSSENVFKVKIKPLFKKKIYIYIFSLLRFYTVAFFRKNGKIKIIKLFLFEIFF